jgi:hypothetical protein
MGARKTNGPGRAANLKPFERGYDPRRNRKGRGPNRITGWLKHLGAMTPLAASKLCKAWAKELASGGDDMPIEGMTALRLWMSLMSEPTGAILKEVLDRTEGKLPTVIKSWRDDLITLVKEGTLQFDVLEAELGRELAVELFAGAGIPVGQSGEAEEDGPGGG